MPPTTTVHEIIRRADENYVHGTTKIGEHVDFSMHDTIENIIAYLNSKHTSGPKDSLGRDKPFFNIITAAVNIWYRATDIDRKDIRFVPTNSSSVALAFIANVLLQQWMDKNRFGQFLNQWGRTLAQYGSAISKWVESGGNLLPSVISWNRTIVDPIDFNALPRIEVLYKTPGQLRNMATEGHPDYAGYDMAMVDQLIADTGTRKNLSGEQVDNQSEFIQVYEVHGLLPEALLENNPFEADEKLWTKFRQQMHAVSYTKTKNGEAKEYNDYTLYKGREKQDIYQKDDLIPEDGRTLAIGAVESLFDAQWMQNHSMKQMKDTLDLSSKILLQTADASFINRNVLTAIETGDILIHDENKPLTQINNSKADITAFENYRKQWEVLGQSLTSTPDAIRGGTLPSGTPYSLGAYLGSQANSLFEIMTENKGLAIEDMMRKYVIPHLKKTLKNKKEIVAILDDAGVREIDSMYVPREAIRQYNKRTAESISSQIEGGGELTPIQPFNRQAEESQVRESLGSLGNKRFFAPDELSQKQWDEVFSDFNWDNIRVEVTNENVDKQAVLTTLASVFQTLASLNGQPLSDDLKLVLGQVLSETGRISPIQLSTSQSAPVPAVGGQPGEGLAAIAQQ